MPRLLRVLLAILAVAYIGGMFFGAAPLRRRWLVSSVGVSPVFIVTTIALAGLLLYAVFRSRLHLALATVGALAVGYMVLVVTYVFPAIDQACSPRKITEEIKALAVGAHSRSLHVFPWVAEKRGCGVLPQAGYGGFGSAEPGGGR